jgi:hypothetical protein
MVVKLSQLLYPVFVYAYAILSVRRSVAATEISNSAPYIGASAALAITALALLGTYFVGMGIFNG